VTLHSDALVLLRAWTPPSPTQERLRDRYVAHLVAEPDGMTRDCFPDHVTASVVVLDQGTERGLLTLHAKARRWYQFGGHCEPADQTLAGVAEREVLEESGVPDLKLDPVPVGLSAHAVPFCGSRGGVNHLDVCFVAVAPAGAVHTVSDESLDVAWWPLDALPNPDPELLELVRLARARVSRHQIS
jgi:8-oxo-dGTP pyrophosphatase MutT (NUDIX family)